MVDFAGSQSEKSKKVKREMNTQDLDRELKKSYGTLGTIPKVLEKGMEDLEIRGRTETIQTTALLRSDT